MSSLAAAYRVSIEGSIAFAIQMIWGLLFAVKDYATTRALIIFETGDKFCPRTLKWKKVSR